MNTHIDQSTQFSNARDRGSASSVTLGVVLTAVFMFGILWLVPHFANPFRTQRIDRTGPAVLGQLRDLSEYHAAQAQLQVIIDQEDDVRFVPSIIAGERVQYLAIGNVDGVVDFSNLSAGAVVVDEETNSVTISLPEPTIAQPQIDLELSHVLDRDRGIVDRVASAFEENPSGEQELIQLATDKLTTAAAATDLKQRAATNTANMLTTLFVSMGFDHVTIKVGGVVVPSTVIIPTTTTPN